MTECVACKTISRLLGKSYMMPLLGHHYPVCRLADVQQEVQGLKIQIVGGLIQRGWTTNDIDVVGERKDIPKFSERLRTDGISQPVHYCGDGIHHSHLKCAYHGVKMALAGKGY